MKFQFFPLLRWLIHLCVCPCLPLSLTHSVAPAEPLLCKFADGGQKKRQTQVKYPQNGRPWTREGEVRLKSVFNHQRKLSSTHRKRSSSAATSLSCVKHKWKRQIVAQEPCLSISLLQHNPFFPSATMKESSIEFFLRQNYAAADIF